MDFYRSLLFAAAISAIAAAHAVDAVTAEAETVVPVDLRQNVCRAVSPRNVAYAPAYCDVTNSGAYVVLQKVEHDGMNNAATNEVARLAADAEGEYSFSLGDGDEPCVRLVHRVYSTSGTELGEPLVRDVAFGLKSSEGDAVLLDSRTNSLQEAVVAGRVGLTYDTAWATNAAAVSLSAVRLSGQDGVETATNSFFTAAAESSGTTPMIRGASGWWRLLCRITGDSGDTLTEYLTGEFKVPGGFILLFK